ncbi:extracellular solute-binding protein [Streptomyces armeniacus]|uniref:Extracellular solute-binding protein n=1 Tax=Streptomyces armeniacus TaxID=83291 RepID=A0A345XSF6_9ACTN|nr:extracellular solute-binding protein [Streptomyces armeniacus]AXK34572.1 extracellular solute-binding protein [Streptomyces armeniacus]
MQRRYAGVVAAGLVASLLATLTACGSDDAQGDKTELHLVAVEHGDRSGNSSKRYWDKLIGEFQFKSPGIDVKVEVFDRDRIDEEIAGLVEAGKAPDLAQTGGSFAGYAEKDKLYSADEILSTATQGDFVPSLAEAGTVRRQQYGLPFVASTRALFYNKDLFADAGIKRPPGTWEQLRKDAVALRSAGVKTPYGLPLGPEDAEAETLNWLLGGGGGYSDDGGAYDIDSPQNVQSFEWLRDKLVKPGLTQPDPATTSRDDAYADFMNGKVAMLNGHPTLMQRALESGVDYGIAPLPGRNGPTKTTTGVADWMMAFKQGGHQDEIRTFLDFVYQEKNVVEYADKYDLLPVTAPASQAMRDDTAHKPLWEFLDWLPTATFYPVGKTSWTPTVRALRKSIGTAVTDKGSPAAVLGQVQRSATATEVADGS